MEFLNSTEGLLLVSLISLGILLAILHAIIRSALKPTNQYLETQNRLMRLMLEKEGVDPNLIESEISEAWK